MDDETLRGHVRGVIRRGPRSGVAHGHVVTLTAAETGEPEPRVRATLDGMLGDGQVWWRNPRRRRRVLTGAPPRTPATGPAEGLW